jgi:hypothetical protein
MKKATGPRPGPFAGMLHGLAGLPGCTVKKENREQKPLCAPGRATTIACDQAWPDQQQ